MHSMLNNWLVLFWFSWILFFLNTSNLIKLFISSEILWLIIYIFSLFTGSIVDDMTLYTLSLLIITIASVEFSIGFILIIFFKKVFKNINIMNNNGSDWSSVVKLNNK